MEIIECDWNCPARPGNLCIKSKFCHIVRLGRKQEAVRVDRLAGVIERITFMNEETGFSVIKVKCRGLADLVTVVGNMAGLNIGAEIEMMGSWKTDPRFGRQFAAETYTEVIPATEAGIEKYLGSGLIKGLGPVNAKRIVRCFGEDTIRIIEEEPDRLIEAEGIGPKRVAMIKAAWEEQKEIKNIMLFLQSCGISGTYAVKIYKTYQNESIQVVRGNPYRLAEDIWGIGFKTADAIAQKMGFAKNSPERCRAGILYMLNDLAGQGHCFMPRAELISETAAKLEIDRELVGAVVEELILGQDLIEEAGDAVYLPPFYFSEAGAARRIRNILAVPSLYTISDPAPLLEEIQQACGLVYDEVQQEAIRRALAAKFTVITGGPGTGKTTTTLALVQAFEKLEARILMAAPTGRAAKRIAETTGMEAKTIHRLLEFKPGEGFQRNEDHPLECDVLIVDEVSMVDIILFYNLLKAVADTTVVILVGDADQLPSVSAGNVLNDLIKSEVTAVVRLTRIFRQARESMIVNNAHRVNQGLIPNLKGGRDSDFFFIEEEQPEKAAGLIRDLCARRLPAYYGVDPLEDIQVLAPMQRGETGTANLNQILQDAMNPHSAALTVRGVQYRVHDKVMQTKNNYDKNVFNGDIGRIVDINQEEKTVSVQFDSTIADYDAGDLDELVLAYAITIHKSQGSEYDTVVCPISTQHYMMLQRNLLYTCITRAKKRVILVGSRKALAMAVKNNKLTTRNTMLAARLRETGEDHRQDTEKRGI